MSIPALEIPIRFKIDGTGQQLAAVGAAGKAAGDAVASGMQHAKQETDGLSSSVEQMVAGGAALGTLKQVAGAISQTMQDAAEYTKRLALEFTQTRAAMQGIAALTGKINSNEFTLGEVQKAAGANLKPDEWVSFRDAFLAKASNYIGSGPSSRLSDEESDKYQAAMAEYAKLHKVSPGEMAGFAGGLLAQQKGKTTAEAMMSRAGKVFATLEASSSDVSHLLPGMTRVMAQGFQPEEAAPILAQMPEVAPEEESTHLLRLVAEIRRLNLEGKAGAYGITDAMSPAKQLETLVATMHARSKGGTDAKGLDKLIQEVTHEDIAAATLRGLTLQGPEGAKTWQGILARTPGDIVSKDIATGRESEPGKWMRAQAQLALSEAERGERFAGVQRVKTEAEAQLVHEKRFDQPDLFEDTIRWGFGKLTGVKPKDQLIQERALWNAQGLAGVPESRRGELPVGPTTLQSDAAIQKLLAQAEQQTAHLKKMADNSAPPKAPTLGPVTPPGVGPRGGG